LTPAAHAARKPQPCRLPNLEAVGDLTQAEIDTVWDFQRRTGARSLKFGVWPTNVGLDVAGCGGEAVPMQLTAAAAPIANLSGTSTTAAMTSDGLWRCAGGGRLWESGAGEGRVGKSSPR
jgi:hypothetical protein